MSERIKRDFAIWNQISFCAGTLEKNIERIYQLKNEQESAYICLVGVPFMVWAQKDPELAMIVNSSTMTAVDGMPIVRRARRLGIVCDRFAAPDFMYLLLEKGLSDKKRHFFYGSTEEVLHLIEHRLMAMYPDIQICGMYSPPFHPLSEQEDEEVIQMINNAMPDFLWVGLGGNKQDKWMYEHYKKIRGCTMLGVGAGFDYLAGTLNEMPNWMEEHSLGWLYRLWQEPKRLWKRYIVGGIKYMFYNIKYSFSEEYRDRLC